MASIPPPTFPSSTRNLNSTPHKLNYATPKLHTTSQFNHRSTNSSTLFSHPLSRVLNSPTICRCHKNNDFEGNNSDNGSPGRWDSAFHENIRNVINWFDNHIAGYRRNHPENVKLKTDDSGGDVVTTEDELVIDGDEDWDWERWKKHFTEVDKQEIIVSILESQLHLAVAKEDYEEAGRIKVAIAAAATNDIVSRAMSQLNKAIKEERYKDAAFIRDHASAGLVGWWAGFSDDSQDPYGCIIQISAEHGRYLARSYTPRQLAKAADGAPLFEVFITMNENGEYKHQVVYLKQSEDSKDFPIMPSTTSSFTSTVNPISEKGDLFANESEDTDDFESILLDMIPGVKDVKIKVMNVSSPGKIDNDLISKMVEQIMEEEDEDENEDDEENDDIEQYDINFDIENEGNGQIEVKIVVDDLVENVSSDETCKDLIRIPAKLEKKNNSSFTLFINKENQKDSLENTESLRQSDGGIRGSRNVDNVMVDLAKSIGRGKIPMKVFEDVTKLINLTIGEGQNYQSLSGSTTFNRIELPLTGDPLNGIYVGGNEIYNSEVIQLKRKFGQWQEDDNMKDFTNLEFYEYVEAVKITGDPHIPAGQVAFRAKVGSKYQLPHRGIIPEEFGVIARYNGQGRVAEPGFQNPKWVEGELVILDGKYTNGGPVVGFLYWAPGNHFLVFFNQLRLQEL